MVVMVSLGFGDGTVLPVEGTYRTSLTWSHFALVACVLEYTFPSISIEDRNQQCLDQEVEIITLVLVDEREKLDMSLYTSWYFMYN